MFIGILTVDLRLEGCNSLKEKRYRLRKLRDLFGKSTNSAVCESKYQNKIKLSQWSFVVIGNDKKKIDSSLSKIEVRIDKSIDAYNINHEKEII